MVLSALQQVVVSVVLVLCVFVVMPRMLMGRGGGREGGGRGDLRAARSPRGGRASTGHYDPRQYGKGQKTRYMGYSWSLPTRGTELEDGHNNDLTAFEKKAFLQQRYTSKPITCSTV